MNNGTYSWYILEDVGPTEYEFRDALLAANKEPGWRGFVKDAVVPTVTATETKDGKSIQAKRVYQSGRILAQLADHKILGKIQNNDLDRPTAFKSKHVSTNGAFRIRSYISISDDVAGRYFGVGVKAKPLPSKESDLDYALGDKIQVMDGAFRDQTGLVKSLNFDTGEVTVSIAIFGRTQIVDLFFDQVRPPS